MEANVLELFMKDVFELAEAETGSDKPYTVANYIKKRLDVIFDVHKLGKKEHFPMSYKVYERYYKKFIKKIEDVDGYSPPNDENKFQLARFLGYENFESWKAHIYKDQNMKKETYIGGIITKIDRVDGDININ